MSVFSGDIQNSCLPFKLPAVQKILKAMSVYKWGGVSEKVNNAWQQHGCIFLRLILQSVYNKLKPEFQMEKQVIEWIALSCSHELKFEFCKVSKSLKYWLLYIYQLICTYIYIPNICTYIDYFPAVFCPFLHGSFALKYRVYFKCR